MLSLRVDAAMSGEEIALDLDDAYFSSAMADAQGTVAFAFPFPPRSCVQALPRRGRGGAPLADAPCELTFDATRGHHARTAPLGVDCAAADVAIVVPIYDAPDAVERCLDSVIEHTTGRARLILIDDASPDDAIAPLLARYATRANVTLLRNAANRGFTATANRGMAEAGPADVVLLNADTAVGPNWLVGLRRAAYCAKDIATATAVSDNAGAFSVPELERENALPANWSVADTARALWQTAGLDYPELPTGNAFCMYVRRSVIDAVGAFDEAAFPQGYGEENDFCQRASARGLKHVIAGNVFVHHERSRSFGHERRVALGVAGMAVLRERWPRYEADVGASLHSFERRVLDWRVRRVFANAAAAPRRRVLRIGGESEGKHHESVREPAIADDAGLWDWLQIHAIDAVSVESEVPSRLMLFAKALGIPVVRGARSEAAFDDALASASTFAEHAR
ncbi:MAG TPA: glycosyltransferase [Rhodanobacteraceae bacterium]|nr:glycosyltransferase [Rhodanobacteraceae bacterium]